MRPGEVSVNGFLDADDECSRDGIFDLAYFAVERDT